MRLDSDINVEITHIVVIHIRLDPRIPIPAEKFLEMFRFEVIRFVP